MCIDFMYLLLLCAFIVLISGTRDTHDLQVPVLFEQEAVQNDAFPESRLDMDDDDNRFGWYPKSCGDEDDFEIKNKDSTVFLVGCGTEEPLVQKRLDQEVKKVQETKRRNRLEQESGSNREPTRTGKRDPTFPNGNAPNKVKVMIIEDGCILKYSFFGKTPDHPPHPSMEWKSKGLSEQDVLEERALKYDDLMEHTYMWAQEITKKHGFYGMMQSEKLPSDFHDFFKSKGDPGWCMQQYTAVDGVRKMPVLKDAIINTISIFDVLAPKRLRSLVYSGTVSEQPLLDGLEFDENADIYYDPADNTEYDRIKSAMENLKRELSSTDMVILDGGNPDMMMFVLGHLAKGFTAEVKSRLNKAELMWYSQGAGAMVTAADFGLSYEAHPFILKHSLDHSTRGLRLIGNCAMRPHWKKYELWHFTTLLAEGMTHLTDHLNFLKFQDGMAIICHGSTCEEFKKTYEPNEKPTFPQDRGINRMLAAFEGYYKHEMSHVSSQISNRSSSQPMAPEVSSLRAENNKLMDRIRKLEERLANGHSDYWKRRSATLKDRPVVF